MWKDKIIKYLKESPGSGFVIIFMILLMLCPFLLILKRQGLAEKMANWAYFFLVIGVILKIIESRKWKEEDTDK